MAHVPHFSRTMGPPNPSFEILDASSLHRKFTHRLCAELRSKLEMEFSCNANLTHFFPDTDPSLVENTH